MQLVRRAHSRTIIRFGNMIVSNMLRMPMTTNSSIKVNATRRLIFQVSFAQKGLLHAQ